MDVTETEAEAEVAEPEKELDVTETEAEAEVAEPEKEEEEDEKKDASAEECEEGEYTNFEELD